MHIIIVGAGIGGLSAGIALRRAGHTIKILEQSSLAHEVGAAITITPNASRILRSWNFEPRKSKMVELDGSATFHHGGTMKLLDAHRFRDIEELYGFPVYTAHRVDLHSQLKLLATQREGLGLPVEIQVRARVIDYIPSEGTVILEDHRVLKADLIVAADGVHSLAIPHILGGHTAPSVSTGWSCMRWLVPTQDLLSDPETAPLVKLSSQRFFAGTKSSGGLIWYPCRDNEIQNFGYLSSGFDDLNATEDFRASVDRSVLLKHAGADFGPALNSVIRKAREVKFWKLIAREPIPTWHKDKLVLIGDAAHPMLPFQGQGGGQAIEDGAALGVLFEQLNNLQDIETRLQMFEKVRRDRGSSLQILSNSNPPLTQDVRDAASEYIPGKRRLEDSDAVNKYVFSFDVVKECRYVLAQ